MYSTKKVTARKNKCSLFSQGSLNSERFGQKLLLLNYIYTVWKDRRFLKSGEPDRANFKTEFHILLDLHDLISTKISSNLKLHFGKGRNITFKLVKTLDDESLDFLISGENIINLWNNNVGSKIDCVTQLGKKFSGNFPHSFVGVAVNFGFPYGRASVRLNLLETPNGDELNKLSGKFSHNIWKNHDADFRIDIESNYEWTWPSRKYIGGGIRFSKDIKHFLSIKSNRTFERIDQSSVTETEVIIKNNLWESDNGFVVDSSTSFKYISYSETVDIAPNMVNWVKIMDASIFIFAKDYSKMLSFGVNRSKRTLQGSSTSLGAYYKQTVWKTDDGASLSTIFFIHKHFADPPNINCKLVYGVGVAFSWSFSW